MKKFLLLVLCAVAAWAGAATIQWYSDQAATTSLADTDIVALERPVPHGYKSFTLSTLKGYIGTNGVMVFNYITVNYLTNVNVLVTTNFYATYSTNINQYVTNQYVNYSYVTNQYVTFQTNQYLYTTNVLATYITNNYLYTTNVTAQYITNNYLYSTNAYITYLTNLYLFTTNVTAQFITNNYLYTTNIYTTYINVLSNVYVTNMITAKTAYITNVFYEGSFPLLATWPGPTNSLNVSNQWEYVTYTPCAITNFAGGVAAHAADSSLAVSNASSSNITFTITATDFWSGDFTNSYTLTNSERRTIAFRRTGSGLVEGLARWFKKMQ